MYFDMAEYYGREHSEHIRGDQKEFNPNALKDHASLMRTMSVQQMDKMQRKRSVANLLNAPNSDDRNNMAPRQVRFYDAEGGDRDGITLSEMKKGESCVT